MEETLDTLLTKAKNKFLLSNAVAGRAKQISQGSLPYVNNFDPTNPILTAIREIATDKIKIKVATGESKKAKAVQVLEEEEGPTALEKLAKGAKSKKKKETAKSKK